MLCPSESPVSQAVAMAQSALYQMTLSPSSDGYFYSRVAVISYATTAKVQNIEIYYKKLKKKKNI